MTEKENGDGSWQRLFFLKAGLAGKGRNSFVTQLIAIEVKNIRWLYKSFKTLDVNWERRVEV